MKNVILEREGNTLIIKVDMTKRNGVSRSGKSTTIATTMGNQPIPGDEGARIGLNIYVPSD